MAENNSCINCGSERIELLFHCKDYLVSGEEFQIVRCPDCGLVKTDNPPSESIIGKYYLSEDYISHSDTKKGITDRLYHFARNIMLQRKKSLISRLFDQKKGLLLDIGSGTGYFPAYMQEKGWEVQGIEISEQARNFSKSKFGISVFPPEETDNIHQGTFDCITLWHVMEHFNDPIQWLVKIKYLLKDDGYCVIAVPNVASSDARWFGKYWAAYDVPRHLWHFTPDTFSEMATRNGFTLTSKRGMALDVFYISILSYKNKNASLPFIRGVLAGILLSFRNCFRRDSSSSLIYILRKQPA
ncbi:MAG TPA: class I SAM-dependent methyltransferase [Bacteroidales bacterium]|nr:class I SAM-dependent methyltransferase [Bacteroidales bacterium]